MKFTTIVASVTLLAALATAQTTETTVDALRNIYYR